MTVFKGVPPEIQAKLAKSAETLSGGGHFADSVWKQLELTEVEVSPREKDGKLQSRVTYTTTVSEDMLNLAGIMHGGCAVFLIDLCSSLAVITLAHASGKAPHYVSQAINTTFHAPAPLGAKLEIVNTTLSFGTRTVSAVTKIWDVTNKRLCMTGVHNKMAPSKPKL
ncbi:hypothetical protein C8Q74DRAFT_1320559 [Fomes fomentarius]|nr:hypothetical protein C8Q74DRAFT_1320559 [Fomes fomentarius]